MAFPVVESRATSVTTSNATSHTISLPTGITVGDRLLVSFATDGVPGISGALTTDWTLFDLVQHSTNSHRMWTYTRIADGTEGSTVGVTTANIQNMAAVALRISGAGDLDKGAASGTEGTSANPNPGEVIPTGGAKDYLVIALNATDEGVPSTAAPTNYANLQAPDSGTATHGVAMASAERSLNAASEDPGAFTAASTAWVGRTIVVHPAAAGVDLVIQDASHAHSAESQSLTQVHELAVDEASHGHAADQQALTQVHELAVQESGHAHTADGLSLAQVHNLITADGLHAHGADNVTLAPEGELEVAGATHGHSADALALTQVHELAIQDASHGHSAESLVLSQVHVLGIEDAAHGLTSDELDLGQLHIITVADGTHAHTADEVVLSGFAPVARRTGTATPRRELVGVSRRQTVATPRRS